MELQRSRPKLIYLLLGVAVLLNFSGLFIPIMAADAARYASIAKTMVVNNNYLELYCDGVDWLDKPHFPFWLTALSFKIFGINTWAYKLPGILFMLMGAWYTYLLGKRLYNKEIALWAVLILLTAEHIILSNNDVRAEPYLTGLIIASVYHFYGAYKDGSLLQLVLGSLFAGCAVMTKGIFALIPIGGAIAGELLIKKDWRNLFHWRWLVAGVLTLVFMLPELYALYYQFDLHPEKIVFGTTNVSGLKFFFWDSQFGRFFNTGPIKGQGDPFFFVHTTLWAFLPWSVMLYITLFVFIRKHSRAPRNAEWLTVCGSLLTFIVFSASQFQLPHYLNIVFPFFAILTAQYLYGINSPGTIKKLFTTQIVIISLLLIAVIAIHFLYRPESFPMIATILIIAFVALLLFSGKWFPTTVKENILYKSIMAIVAVNLYLNLVFYPSLLNYQAGSEAAFWINKTNTNRLPVATMHYSYPFQFYLQQPLELQYATKKYPPVPFLVYLTEDDKKQLEAEGRPMQILKQFDNFTISMLDMQFVNKDTRAKSLKKTYVAIVKG